MSNPIQNLRKILHTEAERGFDNNGIIGGLDKMIPFWEPQARKAELNPALVDEVLAWLRRYPELDVVGRKQAMQDLAVRLEGEAPPEPPPAKAAAPPVRPQPKPARPPETSALARPEQSREKAPQAPAGVTPDSDITVVRGVGPKQAARLAKLGIHTLHDALTYFPYRHVDYSVLKPINRLTYGEEVTIVGTIHEVNTRRIKGGRSQLTQVIIGDGTGEIQCTWFNQPWIRERFKPGRQIQIAGKTDLYLGKLVFTSPDWEWIDVKALHTGRLVPIYRLTAGLTPKAMRSIMYHAVHFAAPQVGDPLPAELRERRGFPQLGEALIAAHFPDTQQDLTNAQRRLGFDELLFLQLGMQRQRAEWQAVPARPLAADDAWLAQAAGALPYELTGAQQRVLADVRADLARDVPMNRLIQGDVGSGKTVVAALALAIGVHNGAQGAFMAPTSILAEQHFQSVRGLLARIPDLDLGPGLAGVRLLQGSTPAAEREAIAAGLADGSVKILVGTHALIQESVQFSNLGVAVVDEQHRFGVEQRGALRGKGANPHLLVMTATPIPRSLALTVYGDLDVSLVDEMPPGRRPVDTRIIYPRERERAYQFLRRHVERGRQAFIVCPLVEESEAVEARAAVDEHARLSSAVFPDLRLQLLHGKMKPAEKEAVMEQFRAGEADMLVSTSVIEVGVDVPNATVMLVEGANRFGLAQLHQLRGRVGRGEHKSYCLLMAAAPENGSRMMADDEVDERLQAMAATTDGFVLAEKDLELRGPGEFLGTRQAGFSELRMARLTDLPLIDLARREAARIFETDPDLAEPDHALLAARVADFWQTGSGDVS
ncbi:MAG: ATP-dependent DNA helicase RecG [Anaerolineales bacterium]